MKKITASLLALLMVLGISLPTYATAYTYEWYDWESWLTYEGGYTSTKYTKYCFLPEKSVLAFAYETDEDYVIKYPKELYAGSDMYVPIGAMDAEVATPTVLAPLADEGQIQDDDVAVSYSIINGPDYVDRISLVNGGQEALPGLSDGMYAKIELADDYLPLSRSRVQVRLVLSVNGVSYQETAVTFRCYIINRIELIKRNSVFGALKPAQFHSLEYGGEVTFDFGEGVRYITSVKPRSRYYMNLDRTPDDTIEAMYPDAYIEYYSFLGNNDTFDAKGKLEIPIEASDFLEQREDENLIQPEIYIYTLKNHTLRAVSLSAVEYDHKKELVTIKTDALQNYVLSSRPLVKELDDQIFNIVRSGYAAVPEDEETQE